MISRYKELTFAEGYIESTIAGTKQITIRKYNPKKHDFEKDEIIWGVFKYGNKTTSILLQIKSVELKAFSDLTEEDAREDGFENAEAAFEGLKKYYPDLNKTDQAAVIRYRVLVGELHNTP